MPDPDSVPLDVEDLFDDFLARLEEGEPDDLPSLLARHPAHAAELRRLHEEWLRLDARLETAFPAALVDGSLALDEEPFGGASTSGSSAGSSASGADSDRATAIDVRPGQIVADYRLVRRIGQGGMGQVWEAEQISLRRRVALKIVRPDRAGAHVVPRLGREARAGGRVDHAGIVSVYAAGESDGIHYIAMQFVDGEDLSDFIARLRDEPRVHGADYRRIASLFADVADAVHAAHRAGILHRDLKPQNILLGPDGSPKVSDFGLAYLADEAARSALPGLVGTYPYMSPEQAAGKDVIIDGRSDVFSLGAVMYETLTLRRAFEGDSGEQIVRRVLEYEPPDPRLVRSRVPADLAVICMKALAKNRADRYASMGEFADELRRFLRNEPILARPPGVLARAGKWIARHPTWSTGLALTSVLMLVISVLLVREVDLRRAAEDQRDRADHHARQAAESARLADERAQQVRAEAYLSGVRAAAMHLDRGHHAEARALLAACPPERRGWEWHHDALRADLSLLRLASPEGAVGAVAMSADGALLAAGLPDGAIRVWSARDGAERAHFAAHQGAVSALVFGADDVLVSAGADGMLALWDASTGVQRASWRGLEPVTCVALSADGALLAAAGEDAEIVLVAPRTPDVPARRIPADTGLVSLSLSADGALIATASHYGTVSLRSTEDGTDLSSTDLPWYGGHTLVQLARDGRRLVTAAEDGRITLWAVPGRRIAELFGHTAPVTALALSADGSRLLSASADDGVLLVWRDLDAVAPPTADDAQDDDASAALDAPTNGAARREDDASGDDALAADTSVSDTSVSDTSVADVSGADASGDPPVGEPVPAAELPPPPLVVWDAFIGRRALLTANDIPPWDDAEAAVSVARTSAVSARFGADDAPVPDLTGHDGRLLAVALSADGRRAAAGTSNGQTLVWDGDTVGARVDLPRTDAPVTSLAVSADGSRVVTASLHEPVLRVWDGATGAARHVLQGQLLGATHVDISSDGARIVSSSYDGLLRVWDERTGALQYSHAPTTRIGAMTFDGAGERIVLGAADGALHVLDARDGSALAVFPGHRGPVVSLAASADGRILASASSDGAVRAWDGFSGAGRWLRAGGGQDDGMVALSADGQRVAWASSTRPTVHIWDTASGAPLAALSSGATGTTALSLSPDGRRVISAAWSNPTLRVWDAETGDVLALLAGHRATVTALAMTDDGARILSTGRDGQRIVWESRLGQAVALWNGQAAGR